MDYSPAEQLSQYADGLEQKVKDRYKKKISCIGIDPFIIPESNLDPECLSPVESIDLVSYLVCETSYYTQEQLKAFRSLQAYNHLVSGFVNRKVCCYSEGSPFSKDERSFGSLMDNYRKYRDNKKCALPRLYGRSRGVLFAHCQCFILYRDFQQSPWKAACTKIKCAWIMPTFVKDVPHVKILTFDQLKSSKKSVDENIDKSSFKLEETSVKSKPTNLDVRAPNEKELENFYAKLNSCNTKTVALSLIPPYSYSFVSRSRNIKTVTNLRDKKYLDIEYYELLNACFSIEFELTDDETRITRKQAQNRTFFRHRAGRIGASLLSLYCSLLQNSSTVTLLSAMLKRTFKFFMRELAPALSTGTLSCQS